MRRFRSLCVRIAGLLSRRRQDADLSAELDSHLQLHIDDGVREGLSPRDARRRALAALGSRAAVVDDWRDMRRVPLLDDTLRDVRDAVRGLRREPLFTLTGVTTLALTIGALATVMSLADAFYWRRLPLPNAHELVTVDVTRDGTDLGFVSFPDYLHFRDAATTLDGLAAHYSTAPLFVRSGEAAFAENGAVVSGNFFTVLDLQPALGRLLTPADDRVPDRDRVAVISHELWTRRFGRASDAVGQVLVLNDVAFTVVGVLAPGFRGLSTAPSEIYMPTMTLRTGYRGCEDALAIGCTMLRMIGRRARDRTVADVRAELGTLMPAHWVSSEQPRALGVAVTTPRGAGASAADDQMLVLLTLAAAVLLLVCAANLTGALIARGTARSDELRVRGALGASRRRLVRQLLAESVLLGLVGGLGGVVAAVAMTRALTSVFFAADASGRALFYDLSVRPDLIVAVLLVSALTGVAFGVVPAVRGSRIGAAGNMAMSTRTTTVRLGGVSTLIGAQAAVAVTLVILAATLAGSARRLTTHANFDPSPVALLRLRPRLVDYSPAQSQRFVQGVVSRLEAMPGVRSVSMVGTGVALLGLTGAVGRPDRQEAQLTVGYLEVGPRYFETVGTPLLRGREFRTSDTADAPLVAVVNRALATRLWPDRDPLGSPILIGERRHLVVGVVEDVLLQSRAEPVRAYAFAPFWQNPGQADARLQVRTDGDPRGLLDAIVHQVGQVDPRVPVTEVGPMDERVVGRFRSLRMNAVFVAFCGLLTAVLTAIGIYGALTFSVSRRRREIGIRLAIGASPGSVRAMVLRDGLRLLAPGAVVGLGLAAVCLALARSLLYGPDGGTGLVFGGSAALVVAVGLLACAVPAMRASRVAPTEALREG